LNESSDVAALLQAIADRLIPGIPSSLRITVVSQIVEDSPPDKDTRTVLEHVLGGHVQLQHAIAEQKRESASRIGTNLVQALPKRFLPLIQPSRPESSAVSLSTVQRAS